MSSFVNPQQQTLSMLNDLVSKIDDAQMLSAIQCIHNNDASLTVQEELVDCNCDPVQRKAETAEEALKILKDGNNQFVENNSKGQQLNSRAVLTRGQKPFAIIVTCADSRVSPELIFDQNLGDLFVIRVAGNVIDSHARASILYAMSALQVKLVVIMGHQSCGAVNASFLDPEAVSAQPKDLQNLIKTIQEGTGNMNLPANTSADERTVCGVVCNVNHQSRCLSEQEDVQSFIQKGATVLGAYYGFNGAVSFFE